MQVLGVDGFKTEWIVIELRDSAFAGASIHKEFSAILESFPDASTVGVDIPIGIPARGRRGADAAARDFVGPRRSSVFFCPPLEVLKQPDHPAASAHHRELYDAGISIQSYGLRTKIFEVDGCVEDRVIEVHPEVTFAHLNGGPLDTSKKSWAGSKQRLDLLRTAGIEIPWHLGQAGKAPTDDVLDAAAAAWSADRYARREAKSLPPDPPIDSRGRRVAIWY